MPGFLRIHVMAWAYGVTATRCNWRFGAVSLGPLDAPI